MEKECNKTKSNSEEGVKDKNGRQEQIGNAKNGSYVVAEQNLENMNVIVPETSLKINVNLL